MTTRQLLLAVTARDCRWDYYRGSGKGGQKRNKTSSAVRCTHSASGAVGQAEDGRSQTQNKKTAFARMSKTEKFHAWLRLEIARKQGKLEDVQAAVEKNLRPENLRVEKRVNEKWEPFE